MSDPDPLAAIKARWFTDDMHRAEYWADLASRDVPWLVDEVARLRDLIARLEWPETLPGAGPWHVCPVCSNHRDQGHDPDCWLAVALAGNDEGAPPPK